MRFVHMIKINMLAFLTILSENLTQDLLKLQQQQPFNCFRFIVL